MLKWCNLFASSAPKTFVKRVNPSARPIDFNAGTSFDVQNIDDNNYINNPMMDACIIPPNSSFHFRIGYAARESPAVEAEVIFSYISDIFEATSAMVILPIYVSNISFSLSASVVKELLFVTTHIDFGAVPARRFKPIGRETFVDPDNADFEKESLFSTSIIIINGSKNKQIVDIVSISSEFAIDGISWVVPAGDEVQIPVEFHPQREQTQYIGEVIFSYAYGTAVVELKGIGASAELILPESLDFARVKYGSTTVDHIQIRNAGMLPTIYQMEIKQSSPCYLFEQEDELELIGSLNPGESRTINIKYSCLTKISPIAMIEIQWKRIPEGDIVLQVVPLVANIGYSNFVLDQSELDFKVTYIDVNRTVPCAMHNSGSAPCAWKIICESPFITSDIYSGIIYPKETVLANFTYKPTLYESHMSEVFFITDSSTVGSSILCSGVVGVPYLQLPKDFLKIDFGIVTIERPHSKVFEILNSSKKQIHYDITWLSIKKNGLDFSIDSPDAFKMKPSKADIPSGENFKISILFFPKEYGVRYSGTYIIQTTHGEQYKGAVTAVGGMAIISIKPPAHTLDYQINSSSQSLYSVDTPTSILENHIANLIDLIVGLRARDRISMDPLNTAETKLSSTNNFPEQSDHKEDLALFNYEHDMNSRYPKHKKQIKSNMGDNTAIGPKIIIAPPVQLLENVEMSSDLNYSVLEHHLLLPTELSDELKTLEAHLELSVNAVDDLIQTGFTEEDMREYAKVMDISPLGNDMIYDLTISKESKGYLGDNAVVIEHILTMIDSLGSTIIQKSETNQNIIVLTGLLLNNTKIIERISEMAISFDLPNNEYLEVILRKLQQTRFDVETMNEVQSSFVDSRASYKLEATKSGLISAPKCIFTIPNEGNIAFTYDIKSIDESFNGPLNAEQGFDGNPTYFTISPSVGCILPGQTMEITANFVAITVGNYMQTFSLKSGAAEFLRFDLQSAVGEPQLKLETAEVEFGMAEKSTECALQIKMTNTGSYHDDWRIDYTTVGDKNDRYRPTFRSGLVSGKLAAGEIIAFDLIFCPPDEGEFNGIFTITWTKDPIVVKVRGTGGVCKLLFTYSDSEEKFTGFDFGTCVIGSVEEKLLKMQNIGDVTAAIEMTHPNSAITFDLPRNQDGLAMVRPGMDLMARVIFRPENPSVIREPITINAGVTTVQTISFKAKCGSNSWQCSGNLEFPNAPINHPETLTVSVQNTGTLDISFDLALQPASIAKYVDFVPVDNAWSKGRNLQPSQILVFEVIISSDVPVLILGDLIMTTSLNRIKKTHNFPIRCRIYSDLVCLEDQSDVSVGMILVGQSIEHAWKIYNFETIQRKFRARLEGTENDLDYVSEERPWSMAEVADGDDMILPGSFAKISALFHPLKGCKDSGNAKLILEYLVFIKLIIG